jgi:hypothetical protein
MEPGRIHHTLIAMAQWLHQSLRPTMSVLLGSLDELGEGTGVIHRHLGQHLPIDLDLGSFETGDELGVGGPVLTRGGIDAGYP